MIHGAQPMIGSRPIGRMKTGRHLSSLMTIKQDPVPARFRGTPHGITTGTQAIQNGGKMSRGLEATTNGLESGTTQINQQAHHRTRLQPCRHQHHLHRLWHQLSRFQRFKSFNSLLKGLRCKSSRLAASMRLRYVRHLRNGTSTPSG